MMGVGTIPADRGEWIIVMIGSREDRKDLTKTEGKGSSWQVEGLDWRMLFEILEDGREKTKKVGWEVFVNGKHAFIEK